MKLPHLNRPCANCPFRNDAQKGWLGEERMREILAARSFVCHKDTSKQCAGHMLIKGMDNDFVQLANRLGIPLKLSGTEMIFKSESACVEHHRHIHRQKG